MAVAFQPFCPVGNDGSELTFHTPSWSRPSHEGHELSLRIDDLKLHCTCEDSVMRQKNWHKPGDPRLCKHGKVWSAVIWPVIAKALGRPS